MSIKIADMEADGSIGGAEKIPVSDAGSPKSVTIDQIKAFTIDGIEAISAGTAVTGADGVFVLQSGVLKPVDIDLIAQHAIDTIWAKSADAAPAGTDKIPMKDAGTTENTVTLAVLAEYVRATIASSILDVSGLDAATSLSSSDNILVTVGTTGKKVAFSVISASIYSALAAHVASLTSVSTPADTDAFYVLQGGVAKKVTLSTLKTVLGSAIAPATTTENKVPQWSSGQKSLKDGLVLRTAVRATGTADDVSAVTEKAVRDAITPNSYAEIFVSAKAMTSVSSSVMPNFGSTPEDAQFGDNLFTYPTLKFDTEADQTAEFALVMPPEWDRGPIKFKYYWSNLPETGASGKRVAMTLDARCVSDGEALDHPAPQETGALVADVLQDSCDLHVSPASPSITVAGTVALGGLVHFVITRIAGYGQEDLANYANDLILLGVLIQYQKANAVTAW